MQKRWTTCSRRSRAPGLTLIEVVAALAILATLLVGIVIARSRHTQQLVRARAQAQAVQAADALIAGWWAGENGVPIGKQGVVAGSDRLRWRTRLVGNAPIEDLGARVVRVELIDTLAYPHRATPISEPVLHVDLVLRDPEVEARERRQDEQAEHDKRGGGDA